MKRLALASTTALLILSLASPAAAGRGRHREPGIRSRLNITVGTVDPFEASVVETNRPINQLRPENQRDNAESFALQDFGFDRSNDTVGLSFEHMWKYFTIFVDASQMDAAAIGAAPRDLFMSVDEIVFDGQRFDYQAIAEGTVYNADLETTFLNTRLAYTPFTFNPDGVVQFVPWVHLGVFGIYGTFDVDAGLATGIQIYENPPRNYVIGGQGSGDVAAFGPELGLGGELKFKLGHKARLTLQGNYSIFKFSGQTSDLGASARNDKSLDYDYSAFDGRAFLEFPMGQKSKFLIGAEYKVVDISALTEAIDRPLEQVVALREKFNKNIDMSITTVNITAGFRF
ncbi:MAG: hypothetical protein VYE73_12050 [Acidobacteriota bacterium]|nr:hypothetical protein [Acidobacteriota bacterium]